MDLSKHLTKAAEAVKRRNYPFAIKLYHQLLALQPDAGKARAGLRQALFKQAAQKAPSKVFALLGGGIHLLTAKVLRILGRHRAAAAAYERYLVHDPLDEAANLKLGSSLQGAGLEQSALAVFQCYAEYEPRCLEASRQAGSLLYARGEFDAALTMYEQALKVDPRDQLSLKARKNLAAEGALRSTGLESAGSSRELIKDKTQQRQLERAERLQLSAEELEAELAVAEAKLADNPDDVRSLIRCADLHQKGGDQQSSLDCLERALQVRPGQPDIRDRVGDLRLVMQKDRVEDAKTRGDQAAAERAGEFLQKAQLAEYVRRVEQNPTDLALRYLLGMARLEAGQHDEAIAELQKAVKDPRKQVESYLLLGRAFQAKGLGDLARGQLEKGLVIARTGGEASKQLLYELGLVAEDMGERAAALKHFSGILEQDIGFRDAAKRVEHLKST